jgi:hypothetical protein
LWILLEVICISIRILVLLFLCMWVMPWEFYGDCIILNFLCILFLFIYNITLWNGHKFPHDLISKPSQTLK